MFAPGVKERRKPPGTSPEKSRRRRSRQPAATSLLNDVRSPARRLTGANAHRLLSCESELRIRSCGFPPDLRVSGARQRILRPTTPVETSRPRYHPLYGPRQIRSTDSICWSCWRLSWASLHQMDGSRLHQGGDRRAWLDLQLVEGWSRNQGRQHEAAIDGHAHDASFRLQRRHAACPLVSCAHVAVLRPFQDDDL